jgi:hypothetical protein
MPKKTTKSAIANKLNKAFANHANDETEYGMEFIDLPPGIRNGVAELVDAKLGEYKTGANQGEPFIYLAGTVREPLEHSYVPKIFKDGKVQLLDPVTVNIEGQRTSLLLPLCDTTNSQGKTTSFDDHVSTALNELRKMGVDTSGLEEIGDLPDLLESIKTAGIFFKYGTSSSDPTSAYPEPRTWENWYGSRGLEDYTPDTEDDVEDNTEASEPSEPEPEEPADSSSEKTDGKLADEGDEDAQARLTEEASGFDIDTNDYETWVEVENEIAHAKDNGAEPQDSEGEDTIPQKEEWYAFTPPRKRKPVEVEITTVNQSKQTCTVKTEADEVYKEVPWSKLQDLPE